jgi:uncharacterized membrane protein YgaE (UPF0421/DUF939 family)
MLNEQSSWMLLAALCAFSIYIWSKTSLWHAVQGSIFMVVIFSNVTLHWTPNNYLAAMIGIAVAFMVTKLLAVAALPLRGRAVTGTGRRP